MHFEGDAPVGQDIVARPLWNEAEDEGVVADDVGETGFLIDSSRVDFPARPWQGEDAVDLMHPIMKRSVKEVDEGQREPVKRRHPEKAATPKF
ncbi:MAG: hypothetical protein MUF13_10580 [Akkermansiaceae bacterium]|nr:hypothetical protein [Akkermansiaceae bacterium]